MIYVFFVPDARRQQQTDETPEDDSDQLLPQPTEADQVIMQMAREAPGYTMREFERGRRCTDDDDSGDDLLPDELMGPLEPMPEIDSDSSSDAGELIGGVDEDGDNATNLIGQQTNTATTSNVSGQHRPAATTPKASGSGAVSAAAAAIGDNLTASAAVKAVSMAACDIGSDSSDDDDSISRGLDFQNVTLNDDATVGAASSRMGDDDDEVDMVLEAAAVAAAQEAEEAENSLPAPAADAAAGHGFSFTVTNFLGGLMQRGIQQAVTKQMETELKAQLADALGCSPPKKVPAQLASASASSSEDSDFELLSHADCREEDAESSKNGV